MRDTPVLLSSSTVYACITGISADIAKLPLKLMQKSGDIWEEIAESHGNSPDSAVLQLFSRPNHYQNSIEFIEQWMLSKLLHGNTYALKQRDERGNVDALYILHPLNVTPFISDSGDVFYQLKLDALNQSFTDGVLVPAREIIHDRIAGLWHPLVGVSPLFACAHTATLQSRITDSQSTLAGNKGMPGGFLYHPGHLSDEDALALKEAWQSGFTGDNAGKVAVLADGLKFEAATMTALNQQLAEQLKWTNEDIARAFHYPIWLLAGPQQPHTTPEQSNTAYFTGCLQIHIEKLEKCLGEGLSIAPDKRINLDEENLLRMDKASLIDLLNKSARILTVNEQRQKLNAGPIAGGNTVYLQEQDHSLQALDARDRGPDPFGTEPAPPAPPPTEPPPAASEPDDEEPEERGMSIEYIGLKTKDILRQMRRKQAA